jgi:hypothetical protein
MLKMALQTALSCAGERMKASKLMQNPPAAHSLSFLGITWNYRTYLCSADKEEKTSLPALKGDVATVNAFFAAGFRAPGQSVVQDRNS